MTYYYTSQEKPTRYGRKVTLSIYKIVKRKPILLTTHEYNTASCMGKVSEAFQGLVKAGFLPKKYRYKYSTEIPHRAFEM